jgi:phosphate transport system substrate-binding protein
MAWARAWTICLAASVLFSAGSCSRVRSPNSIKITGSDTMVNLAQAWQEFYLGVRPEVVIQVKGGGSGVGIAALCTGKVEIAPSSRKIKPKEIELAIERTGKSPKEFIVGLDALAIYVHKDNPLDEITIPQLAGIYGSEGDIEQWSQLGVDNTGCRDGEIIRVSRQNSSGTYVYFREAILGKTGDFKLGATSQSGSSDVVALITHTPCAIGYSGMGYRTDGVKMVRVAKKKGDKAIAPSADAALDGTYPISRPLFLYTLGEPEGAVKDFIDWTLSPTGQRIVAEVGYVPKEQQHGA